MSHGSGSRFSASRTREIKGLARVGRRRGNASAQMPRNLVSLVLQLHMMASFPVCDSCDDLMLSSPMALGDLCRLVKGLPGMTLVPGAPVVAWRWPPRNRRDGGVSRRRGRRLPSGKRGLLTPPTWRSNPSALSLCAELLRLADRPTDYFLFGDRVGDSGLDTLNIEAIRDRSSRHDWAIQPHRHPSHHQLLLFTAGNATIRIEDKMLRPAAPCVVIHPAQAVHEIGYAPSTEGLTITVATDYVARLLAEVPDLAAPSGVRWRTGFAAASGCRTTPRRWRFPGKGSTRPARVRPGPLPRRCFMTG